MHFFNVQLAILKLYRHTTFCFVVSVPVSLSWKGRDIWVLEQQDCQEHGPLLSLLST